MLLRGRREHFHLNHRQLFAHLAPVARRPWLLAALALGPDQRELDARSPAALAFAPEEPVLEFEVSLLVSRPKEDLEGIALLERR